MAQHLWVTVSIIRICEACGTRQFGRGADGTPHVSPICSGDPDDDGRRRGPRRPVAPSPAPRVLEDAL
jgi:hypothetical protein